MKRVLVGLLSLLLALPDEAVLFRIGASLGVVVLLSSKAT